MKADIKNFFKYNKHKKLTVAVWILTAYNRFRIRFIPMKLLRRSFGEEGRESAREATEDEYRYSHLIMKHVNHSAENTPWESKCLVRALTAQRLLKRKNIHTTLYLGVGNENNKMRAHAWLRMGEVYVTGGDGEGCTSVACFFK